MSGYLDTGATADDPTGGGAEGNNMVLVKENLYDSGSDGGDGNLTKETKHVDGSTTRVTTFAYDWRNRHTDTDGEIDLYEKVFFEVRKWGRVSYFKMRPDPVSAPVVLHRR